MFKKPTLLSLIFFSLFLAGCNLGGGAPAGFNTDDTVSRTATDETSVSLPETIKIGYIGPLTGNAASYGQDVKKGISVYFADNPTIGDSTVEVIYEDGKCNGQDAANATQKLINVDKVQVILGGQCSGETLAAAPIAEQNQVVLLSPLSSSPEITTAGDYIFRNYPSDDQVGKTLVDDVLANYKTIALLTEQTDYAQGYREVVHKYMKAADQEPVLDEVFPVDSSDFRTLLAKVQESDADVLIFVGQSPVTAGFAVKQAKELGLDVQIYGTDAMPGADFFDIAKDAAEGIKAVYVAEDPNRARYDEVVAKIGPAEAAKIFPLFGYDAAEIIAGAISKVGYDATAIKDYLYTMPTHQGVASDIKFDENGDNQAPAAVRVARNGEFVPAN